MDRGSDSVEVSHSLILFISLVRSYLEAEEICFMLESQGAFPFPFFSQSLRKVGQDSTVLLTCITVFLSYLPEAGQYSSFFLYLRQVSPNKGVGFFFFFVPLFDSPFKLDEVWTF